MGHKLGVHPGDDARIDVGHLKQGWHLRIAGAAIDPDHVSHPPVAALFNDHCHPRPDVHKYRIGFEFCVTAWEAEVEMTDGS